MQDVVPRAQGRIPAPERALLKMARIGLRTRGLGQFQQLEELVRRGYLSCEAAEPSATVAPTAEHFPALRLYRLTQAGELVLARQKE